MNNYYKKYILIIACLIIVFSKEAYTQCVVCVDAPPLITCGETATLNGDGFLTSMYSDDFNTGIGTLWNNVSTGGVTNSNCSAGPTGMTSNCAGGGVVPAGDFLWFPPGAAVPRRAVTNPIPVPTGGSVVFEFKMEQQSGSCDGPDLIGEGVMLQYNTGAGWVDMPANFFPFNQNPMPYTNKAYFCPTNPNLQSFTSWNQYQFPIPVAAYSANTSFRWIQTNPTSTQWDFWGLDNVNINPSSGGATYTWSPGGAGQILSVNPTSLTNYTFTYSEAGISCSTTITVDVAPPVVNPSIVPNPLNPCPASVDLTADVSFNSCNYKVYLFDNGGNGWITVPQTPTSIDNRLEVYIDGVLVNTITMNDLSGSANPYGPQVFSFPVSSGGTFETVFLSGGPNPNECVYVIEDNLGNYISAQGASTSPGLPAGTWPNLQTYMPLNAFLIQPLNVGPVSTTCPTTNPYTYSWSLFPSGSTAGISNPNAQSTVVTTASTQIYEVTATDINSPGCIAVDTIEVIGSGGNWDFSALSPNPACEGDCIDLNFTSSVSTGNFNIVIEMIDDNGSNSFAYTINSAGNNTSTGSPVNLCPITSLSGTATFNITSLVDASDPNNCEIPMTNTSQTINFSSQPNAGTAPLTAITYCEIDPIEDISTYLSNNPDANGTWTYSGGGTSPGNMPFVGLNYIFDPTSTPGGNYTYTVSNAPCIDDIATISINIETPPYAGQLPPINIDMCLGSVIDLNTLFTNNPLPYNPNWSDISSGAPGTNISSNFNPSSAGNYILRNTNPATTNCPEDTEDITIIAHDLPSVTLNSVNQICLGESVDLNFNLTGNAPFIITISDGMNPPFNVTTDINGNDFITGNPISVTPVNTGVSTYTITSIVDSYCSTSVSNQSVNINVLTPPNSGVLLSPLAVCSDDLSIYDLSSQLFGQDLTGFWIDANGLPQPPGPSFNFNTSMSSGTYTYMVTSSVCPDASTDVPVSIITTPNTGTPNPQNICINNYNAGSLYDLNNLLSGSPDPGNWLQSGSPIGGSNIDPSTYGIGTTTFTYQVIGTSPCSNKSIDIDLTINPEPVVNTFTSSAPSTTQGYSIDLLVNMSTGTSPFTIDLIDDDFPQNNYSIFIPSGMNGQVSVFPNVIPTTNYNITIITDANGCTTTHNTIVPVDVIPYPIINPFTTATPEICEGQLATIEFDMTQGVVPVTVNYTLNGTPYVEILNSTGMTSVTIPNALLNFGINTFSITSVIDVNNEPAPNLPNDVQILVNPNPSATFTTTTPITCYQDDAILEFDFIAGTPPFTVNYEINTILAVPSLIFAGMGTQNQTLSPDPNIGTNTYSILNIIDNKGCVGYINTTEDILVNELPDLDVAILGPDPICATEISTLVFPIVSGLAPFNLNLLDGSNPITLNIDAAGLIGGQPYQVSPSLTTTYTLVSVSDANGCSQNLNKNETLTVNPLPLVNITGDNEICDEDISYIYFNFNEGTSPWIIDYNVNGGMTQSTPALSNISDSISASPSTTSTYTFLSVRDNNGCESNLTDAATISVNPLPEVSISGGGEICDDGSKIDVIINTVNGTPTFDINYKVNLSNRFASDVGYQHIINTNEAGTYTITKITDSKGCNAKDVSGSVDVIVNPLPVSNFDAYPQPADITNPVIYFIDNSTGHINGIWDFDDNNTTGTNFGKISHRFPDQDSGTYYVELYVESDKGCYDVSTQKIIIDKAFIFYIPNSFTPNNDQINDIFKPYVSGSTEYKMYVYSRTGEMIFETSDITEGWNGHVRNSNKFAISGRYAYAIEIIDIHGKTRKYQGDFLLIR